MGKRENRNHGGWGYSKKASIQEKGPRSFELSFFKRGTQKDAGGNFGRNRNKGGRGSSSGAASKRGRITVENPVFPVGGLYQDVGRAPLRGQSHGGGDFSIIWRENM